ARLGNGETGLAGIRKILVRRRLFIWSFEATAIRRRLRVTVRPERPTLRCWRSLRVLREQCLVDFELVVAFEEGFLGRFALRHEFAFGQQAVAARLGEVAGNPPPAI